ncbi:MAG TPA: hypothetical protein VD867_02285 [Burkholderiales bacterium]|nr:hypothetical protein [Burkholderiales bacterium]
MTDFTAGRGPTLRDPDTDDSYLRLQPRPISGDAGDASLFAAMRFILAFTGLAIIYFDPTDPGSREALTYGAFALYCVYAATVLVVVLKTAWAPDQRLLSAFDILFASMLVLWTHGANSIFFYVFLFPILVVSFSHGYRDGLIFTLASVAAFLVVGTLADPAVVEFELKLALIRPVYLLALGYMIARWGGREILFNRRLMLLRDVNASSARAGLDQVIEHSVRRILDFHNAQQCVLALHRAGSEPRYVIYAAARSGQRASAREMTADSSETLLRFRDTESILYSSRTRMRRAARCSFLTVDGSGERESPPAAADCELVAGLLEARSFVAVPYLQSDGTRGRLFLTSNRGRYTGDDVQFLLQFTAAVSKVIENLQLVDELISSAAEHERAMISRDIHDAAVQPYIGLRLALEALYRDGGSTSPLSQKILDLVEMANATVHDLRGYTRGLVAGSEIPGGSLSAALLMQADRHKRFYGLDITTDVDAKSGALGGRFASQVFYIVVEALSNVVKHTTARRAFVEVKSHAGSVGVRVGNEQSLDPDAAPDFIPRSIKSRVAALGGSLEVQHGPRGHTVVHAVIPT